MSGAVQDFIQGNAGPRDRALDEHNFLIANKDERRYMTFRLQLFTGPGLLPVAVATQTLGEGGDGQSLVNGAERACREIWRRACPDSPVPPVVVAVMWMAGKLGYGPSVMTFLPDPGVAYEVLGVEWGPELGTDGLAELVGVGVDLMRGDGSVPATVEPDPELIYRAIPVGDLPRPEPWRKSEAPCMVGRLRVRYRLARLTGRRCCDYHAGDWSAACVAAVEALGTVRDTVPVDDVASAAVSHLKAADLSGWERRAAQSLFFDPIQPHDDSSGYVNGNHRAQAMIDQRVHLAVVAYLEYPHAEPE